MFKADIVHIRFYITINAVGYLYIRDKLDIPDVDLSIVSFEPRTTNIGTLLPSGFNGVLVATSGIIAWAPIVVASAFSVLPVRFQRWS